ncbi:hypothetical protein [Nocardia abscessus]|uniref:hypothetical protein n=1 Tax=Nocardia abscessus TaxID=120957 RepID=UPI0002ECB071|nr:hypothetical protein [Nocardia abscessus]MCC3327648.1 hypothetical protein [Nocardia abscessus]
MTRTDPQNFTTLLDSIAKRRSAGDGASSAESSTHDPAVRAADIPQEVEDALHPAETGLLDQLGHAEDTADSGVQRFLAGDISDGEFDDLLDQLMESNRTQFEQLQDSTKDKLMSLGSQRPDWREMILSAFQAASDLLIEVLNREVGFLESLAENPTQQAGQVDEFFSGLARYLQDEWGRTVG